MVGESGEPPVQERKTGHKEAQRTEETAPFRAGDANIEDYGDRCYIAGPQRDGPHLSI